MTNSPGTNLLASTGLPGRIVGPNDGGITAPGPSVDVHIDVIRSISRSSSWERTQTSLERGAALTVHRKRTPETMDIEIVLSDVEPIAGAFLTGLWELEHVSKTVRRLKEAQAADGELRVWDGRRFQRTPAGIQVWVLDAIEGPMWEKNTDADTGYNTIMTLKFGESPRFATTFTDNIENVSPDLDDVVGDVADRGRQSTTEGGDELTAQLEGGVY